MAFRQTGPSKEGPVAIPKMNRNEIESAVTRALQEELARLDEAKEPGEKE